MFAGHFFNFHDFFNLHWSLMKSKTRVYIHSPFRVQFGQYLNKWARYWEQIPSTFSFSILILYKKVKFSVWNKKWKRSCIYIEIEYSLSFCPVNFPVHHVWPLRYYLVTTFKVVHYNWKNSLGSPIFVAPWAQSWKFSCEIID